MNVYQNEGSQSKNRQRTSATKSESKYQLCKDRKADIKYVQARKSNERIKARKREKINQKKAVKIRWRS